jgi:hypothetical protein
LWNVPTTPRFSHFDFLFAIGGLSQTRGRKKLQLLYKPPRHEKNADTDRDAEQHREHRAVHHLAPAAAIEMNFIFISLSSLPS